jgi:hypothetical protein
MDRILFFSSSTILGTVGGKGGKQFIQCELFKLGLFKQSYVFKYLEKK